MPLRQLMAASNCGSRALSSRTEGPVVHSDDAIPRDEIAAFIQANLPMRPVAGVPEILIHTAGPESRIGRLLENSLHGGSPYWAYPWGGGLALARHVLDQPQVVAGRRVIDLGSGSGLVGIAAAKSGAAKVTAVESDPPGRIAIGLNAELNGVPMPEILAEIPLDRLGDFDAVLAGDVFYDAKVARRTTALLDACVEAGLMVLVGGRKDLPLERLDLIAEYSVADFGETAARSMGRVYHWLASGR